MSTQRDLLVIQEALAIMAQRYAADVGEPAIWRGLMKTSIEQAKENLDREDSALQRNQAFDCVTRLTWTEPVDGAWPTTSQVGRTMSK